MIMRGWFRFVHTEYNTRAWRVEVDRVALSRQMGGGGGGRIRGCRYVGTQALFSNVHSSELFTTYHAINVFSAVINLPVLRRREVSYPQRLGALIIH